MVLNNSQETADPKFSNAMLWFDNVVTLRFFFKTSDITNVTVTINNEAVEIKTSEDGLYYVETKGIFALDYEEKVDVKLLVNEEVKSSISYSVYDYIARTTDNTDLNWNNLLKALYAYSISSKSYASSLKG